MNKLSFFWEKLLPHVCESVSVYSCKSANRMKANILCVSFSASLTSFYELGTHFSNTYNISSSGHSFLFRYCGKLYKIKWNCMRIFLNKRVKNSGAILIGNTVKNVIMTFS